MKKQKIVKKSKKKVTKVNLETDFDKENPLDEEYGDSTPMFNSERGIAVRKARESVEMDLFINSIAKNPEDFEDNKVEWAHVGNFYFVINNTDNGYVKLFPTIRKVIAFDSLGRIIQIFEFPEEDSFEDLL